MKMYADDITQEEYENAIEDRVRDGISRESLEGFYCCRIGGEIVFGTYPGPKGVPGLPGIIRYRDGKADRVICCCPTGPLGPPGVYRNKLTGWFMKIISYIGWVRYYVLKIQFKAER